MNKYVPEELENLSASKERIMRNVVSQLEGRKSKSVMNWKVGIVSAVFTAALVFLTIVIFSNAPEHANVQPPPTTPKEPVVSGASDPHPLDKILEKEALVGDGSDKQPYFMVKDNKFHFNGITLGDTKEQVIAQLGENYEVQEQETIEYKGERFLRYDMVYGDIVVKIFENNVTDIFILNPNENYLIKLLSLYDGNIYIPVEDEFNGKHGILLKEESYQLLCIKQDEGQPHMVFLSDIDDNFLYHFNKGAFKKVE